MTKKDEARLNTFLHKHLRGMLKIYLPMRVTNKKVRRRPRACTISEQIETEVALDRACIAYGPPTGTHAMPLPEHLRVGGV